MRNFFRLNFYSWEKNQNNVVFSVLCWPNTYHFFCQFWLIFTTFTNSFTLFFQTNHVIHWTVELFIGFLIWPISVVWFSKTKVNIKALVIYWSLVNFTSTSHMTKTMFIMIKTMFISKDNSHPISQLLGWVSKMTLESTSVIVVCLLDHHYWVAVKPFKYVQSWNLYVGDIHSSSEQWCLRSHSDFSFKHHEPIDHNKTKLLNSTIIT